MREFHEWMLKKEHIGFNSGKLKSNSGYELEGGAPPQMMVGYMIEYLIEKHPEEMIDFWFSNIKGLDNIFEILKHKIETGENTEPARLS